MEKAKRTNRKKAAGASADKLIQAYQEHLLLHGTRPATIYKFCLDAGIREEDFYKVAGSFDALEREIWARYIRQTINSLEGDSGFQNFTAREKLLTFYFTLTEILTANRSFAVLLLGRHSRPEIMPAYLKEFKKLFEAFAGRVIDEGIATQEIAKRPYLDKRYPQLLWVHLGLLLLFWRDDDSASFEKSDVFIEKSINLAFDLMGKGIVESTVDFAKFLYQSKMD